MKVNVTEINEYRDNKAQRNKKKRKIAIIATSIGAVMLILGLVFGNVSYSDIFIAMEMVGFFLLICGVLLFIDTKPI